MERTARLKTTGFIADTRCRYSPGNMSFITTARPSGMISVNIIEKTTLSETHSNTPKNIEIYTGRRMIWSMKFIGNIVVDKAVFPLARFRLVYNIYESCQRKYSFIVVDKAVFPLARFVNIIYQSVQRVTRSMTSPSHRTG